MYCCIGEGGFAGGGGTAGGRTTDSASRATRALTFLGPGKMMEGSAGFQQFFWI